MAMLTAASAAEWLHFVHAHRRLARAGQAAGEVEQAAGLGTCDGGAVAEGCEGQLVAGLQAQALAVFLGDGGLALGGGVASAMEVPFDWRNREEIDVRRQRATNREPLDLKIEARRRIRVINI
jgi:hypothetical protein